MILSNQDINRIKKLGFEIDFFTKEKNGWLQLKNSKGKCVFHDGKTCTIYKNRPDGCKLYPIIYDMDIKNAVLDKDCPYVNKFFMTKIIEKRLYNLVLKIQKERDERKKSKISKLKIYNKKARQKIRKR